MEAGGRLTQARLYLEEAARSLAVARLRAAGEALALAHVARERGCWSAAAREARRARELAADALCPPAHGMAPALDLCDGEAEARRAVARAEDLLALAAERAASGP